MRTTVPLALALLRASCAPTKAPEAPTTAAKPVLPPEPTVTHTAADAEPGQVVDHGEVILSVDDARKALHAQHHPHAVLETRRIPGKWSPAAMTSVADFALTKDRLDVIHPVRHGGNGVWPPATGGGEQQNHRDSCGEVLLRK